jgi:radical SAM enzyme (TIGR01210 family)
MSHAAGAAAYPSRPAERDAWIVSRRPPRNVVSAERPYAFFAEDEVDAGGTVRRVATIFLTNRECPYHCLMCDLWRNTLEHTVPAGAIARQIDLALVELPPATVVKLYNSGSFFDPRAIPPDDHPGIASRLSRFERVIVECHPAFVGPEVGRFRDLLPGELEVAMGLETANPDVLARLNKRMTLASYALAAERLRSMRVASRAFVLVQPPFLPADEAADWAVRSAAFAFDHGAGAVALIPLRAGNGAIDVLADAGAFSPPTLATLESAFDESLALDRGRVFADTWDLERFSRCPACFAARAARLRSMNLTQRLAPRVDCAACASR